jgi:hypothetical protein
MSVSSALSMIGFAEAEVEADVEVEDEAEAGAWDAFDNREAGSPAPSPKRPSETTADANHPAAEVVAAVKDAEDKASSHELVPTSTTRSMAKANDGILAKKKRVYLFTHAWGGMDVLFHVFVLSPIVIIILAVVAGECQHAPLACGSQPPQPPRCPTTATNAPAIVSS